MVDSHRTTSSPLITFARVVLFLLAAASIAASRAYATPCSGSTLAITRISVPVFYFDPSLTPSLPSAYAGYKVTNNSQSELADVWVGIGNFRGGAIAPAPFENRISHVGSLKAGENTVVFFYLSATRHTSTPQTHEVFVYDGTPKRTALLCEQGFSLTSYDTISANPNKVSTSRFRHRFQR